MCHTVEFHHQNAAAQASSPQHFMSSLVLNIFSFVGINSQGNKSLCHGFLVDTYVAEGNLSRKLAIQISRALLNSFAPWNMINVNPVKSVHPWCWTANDFPQFEVRWSVILETEQKWRKKPPSFVQWQKCSQLNQHSNPCLFGIKHITCSHTQVTGCKGGDIVVEDALHACVHCWSPLHKRRETNPLHYPKFVHPETRHPLSF